MTTVPAKLTAMQAARRPIARERSESERGETGRRSRAVEGPLKSDAAVDDDGSGEADSDAGCAAADRPRAKRVGAG
jgi:hypothetical protein